MGSGPLNTLTNNIETHTIRQVFLTTFENVHLSKGGFPPLKTPIPYSTVHCRSPPKEATLYLYGNHKHSVMIYTPECSLLYHIMTISLNDYKNRLLGAASLLYRNLRSFFVHNDRVPGDRTPRITTMTCTYVHPPLKKSFLSIARLILHLQPFLLAILIIPLVF